MMLEVFSEVTTEIHLCTPADQSGVFFLFFLTKHTETDQTDSNTS